jgi:hypothetical protein
MLTCTSVAAPMRRRDNVSNAEAPARESLQCRGAIAAMPMHKRGNDEAPARRLEEPARLCRGVSVAISRRHIRATGASSRRYRLLVPELALFCTAPARTLAPAEHYGQSLAGNLVHARGRATRSEAWALRSLGRAIWGLVDVSLRLAASSCNKLSQAMSSRAQTKHYRARPG